MPTIIMVAGPNGAGKTTFAREYLAADERQFEFVNADEIARCLPATAAARLDILAARTMLHRIDALVATDADFVIETTLASLTYARKIPEWRKRGYLVSLVYLRLSTVNESVARVGRRVEAGGHDIPEETIRRRFDKSWIYFQTIYRPIVDDWHVWRSGEGFFSLIDSWDGRHATRT